MKEVNLQNVSIKGNFWLDRQNLVREIVIPFQEKVMNDEIPDVAKSHALANFRIAAGLEEGEFYGMVFQDTDVAKWLEGVSYSLALQPDEELEKKADDIIDIIEKAQQPDGYLNTFFTLKEPNRKWTKLLDCHELYTAGHMIESAVAYYEATGKDKFLKVMERMVDHIDNRFGYDKKEGVPGHQEIEIALLRLYRATDKQKYLDLAKYFIDVRGQNPNFFVEESANNDWHFFAMNPEDTKYNQSHVPVRQQDVASGHSVRAIYMYTAMADLAEETNDTELLQACERLWDNITQKQMYITGGVGSTVHGEAFTVDYDLPNDTVYAETCASIAMVFFAKKMLDANPHSKYADIMELELYNTVIAGMQLDGKKFFYVNPLEVNPGISGVVPECKHVLPERPGWYACACCPPNVVRLLMSLGKYAWSHKDNTIFSHLIISSDASFDEADISVTSNYPWEAQALYNITPKTKDPFTLSLYIPSHAKNVKITLNNQLLDHTSIQKNGYVYINRVWSLNDTIELTFDMPVRRIRCSTEVRENIGKVALMRGPVVYAFEGVDNDYKLQELWIPETSEILIKKGTDSILQDMVTLELSGLRVYNEQPLYSEQVQKIEKTTLKAIPYFAWGNRGVNQMRVWMMEYRNFSI